MQNYQRAYLPEVETVEIPMFSPVDSSTVYERSKETQQFVDDLEAYQANCDYKNMNKAASKLIGVEFDNVEFWLALAESMIWHFHPLTALNTLGSIRFLFPLNARVYFLKAKCYALIGQLESSFKELDYAFDRDPAYVQVAENDPQMYFVLSMKARKAGAE